MPSHTEQERFRRMGINEGLSVLGGIHQRRQQVGRLGDMGNSLFSSGTGLFNNASGTGMRALNTLEGMKVDEAANRERALETVTQSFEAQNAAREREQMRMGVNPNSGRFAGLQQAQGLRLAEARAGAANVADNQSFNQNLSINNAVMSGAQNFAGMGLRAAGMGGNLSQNALSLAMANDQMGSRVANELQRASANLEGVKDTRNEGATSRVPTSATEPGSAPVVENRPQASMSTPRREGDAPDPYLSQLRDGLAQYGLMTTQAEEFDRRNDGTGVIRDSELSDLFPFLDLF